MFRLNRSRRVGPLLEWKVAVFLVAAGLGLGGIYMEEGWLTGGAIVVLVGGILLGKKGRPGSSEEGGGGGRTE